MFFDKKVFKSFVEKFFFLNLRTQIDMKKKKTTITTALFSVISIMCAAQGPPPPLPPPPVGLPIDNGLIILLALGLLYGAYRILKLKRA